VQVNGRKGAEVAWKVEIFDEFYGFLIEGRMRIVILAVGLWCGAAVAWAAEPVTVPVDADGVQRATVIMDSYTYRPEHLVVQAGTPVELTLKSVTYLVPHNFILDDPAAGFRINEDVSAGGTAVVRFVPPKPGSFVFYCDKKLLFFKSHRDRGMEGRLDVR
jgi:heme/copper-type cytochrome/quinol oxidase subunit 2